MNIALIPARGGSKRIPRKNIKEFHGKPIIAYSIGTALESRLFDRVVVSTDDEEIAELAMSYGASVPFVRPADISDDHATTLDVVKHAVDWFEKQGENPLGVCCIYATAPLLQVSSLALGAKAVLEKNFDYAFSATSFPFPVQRGFRILGDGGLEMLYPEHAKTRSQDLEPVYHDAAQFYWGSAQAFRSKRAIFSGNSRPILLPRHRVQDIDTMEDWRVAEQLYLLCSEIEVGE